MAYIVVPVKMPPELKARIDELAKKGLTNRNHWIVRTLTRETTPKIVKKYKNWHEEYHRKQMTNSNYDDTHQNAVNKESEPH